MPNFGYHLVRWQALIMRSFYRAFLPLIVRRSIQPPPIDLEVFAYSNEDSVPEQVASIRSFLRHVGRPKRFVVVSDGTHSDRSIALLKRVDLSVTVEGLPPVPADLPEKLRSYLSGHPTGKQLALIMTLPQSGPALYLDSDVLFFAGASELAERCREKDRSAFYLADCKFSGDRRLLRNETEAEQPANTGVLLLFRKCDWSASLERFLELEGAPTFFTNQTITHLAMHQNAAVPFDSSRYVLQLDDQFMFSDRYAGAGLVLRHYVNPVRHKLWTSLNK